MILFVFVIYLCILSTLNGEEPISVCAREFPFRLSDSKCANFNAICVKKDDAQCNLLQDACKQCPPSKITVIILQEILRIVKYRLVNFLIVIFTFNVVVVILLMLENRFKLISKCCFSVIKKKKIDYYQLLHSRKRITAVSNFTKDSGVNLKFLVPLKKSIELHVYGNENNVSVKKRICKKWPEARAGSDKMMKLICNGVELDDNQYLMSCITSDKDEITCQVDYSLDIRNILVLRVNGIKRHTELVQIDKDKKISDLNKILCKLLDQSDLVTFVKNPVKAANYSDLNNEEQTLENAGVKDNDRIAAITKISVKTKFSSILEDDEASFEINLLNIEKASTIYSLVKNKFKSSDFVLMMNNQHLKSDKFMFQYHIVDVGEINYCRFYSLSALTEDEKPLNEKIKRKLSKENASLYKAIDNFSKQESALLKYKLSDWKSFKENPNLIKELSRLKIVKSHERFVEIFGLYKSASEIGVSMELMVMSMKNILDIPENRKELVSFKNIVKWSKQILEGLAFLHDQGIIYDNLTMSHIILDSKSDIKLSSISIGKLFTDHKSNEKNAVYRAPELLKNEPWNIKSDVWSFGVVLFEIITGKDFHLPTANNDNNPDWIEISGNESMFPEGKYKWFEDIIKNCLIKNPINRISVKKLQNLIN